MERLGGHAALTEKDLKAVLRQSLRSAAAEAGVSLVIPDSEHPLVLSGFPGVGRADLALLIEGEAIPDALLELKWGAATLWNCVWDAPKLALAVRQAAARSAYLVAGAPTSEWETPVRGAELFQWRVRDIGDYMVVYADLFEHWRKQVKTQPRRLPTPIRTRPVGTAELSVSGEPWRVRIAEVEPAGDDWSVAFEDGREVGRDRQDRFTSFDTHGQWTEVDRGRAQEGRDESGSDRGFWREEFGIDVGEGAD